MPDNRRVEQIRNEQGQFTGNFRFAPPDLPAAREPPPLPAAMTDADRQFMAEERARGKLPQPEEQVAEAPEIDTGVGGAVEGATVGAKAGPIGALAGAAAGFIGSKILGGQPRPIGTLEGGQATSGPDEVQQTLRSLLEVQQRIERVGSPIKDAVSTNAIDSRL
jgi:hypothetical protein